MQDLVEIWASCGHYSAKPSVCSPRLYFRGLQLEVCIVNVWENWVVLYIDFELNFGMRKGMLCIWDTTCGISSNMCWEIGWFMRVRLTRGFILHFPHRQHILRVRAPRWNHITIKTFMYRKRYIWTVFLKCARIGLAYYTGVHNCVEIRVIYIKSHIFFNLYNIYNLII